MVSVIGRTTAEPEIRKTQTGKQVTQFTVAVDRYSGDGQKTADFIQCVAWAKKAEILEKYVRKGDKIGISGHLQTRSYEAKDGSKRHVTELFVDALDLLQPKRQQDDSGYEEDIPF